MATIRCKKGPDLWGWGADERDRGRAHFGNERGLAYHSLAQTKNHHLVISRLLTGAALFLSHLVERLDAAVFSLIEVLDAESAALPRLVDEALRNPGEW